jgi:hypothetical protein
MRRTPKRVRDSEYAGYAAAGYAGYAAPPLPEVSTEAGCSAIRRHDVAALKARPDIMAVLDATTLSDGVSLARMVNAAGPLDSCWLVQPRGSAPGASACAAAFGHPLAGLGSPLAVRFSWKEGAVSEDVLRTLYSGIAMYAKLAVEAPEVRVYVPDGDGAGTLRTLLTDLGLMLKHDPEGTPVYIATFATAPVAATDTDAAAVDADAASVDTDAASVAITDSDAASVATTDSDAASVATADSDSNSVAITGSDADTAASADTDAASVATTASADTDADTDADTVATGDNDEASVAFDISAPGAASVATGDDASVAFDVSAPGAAAVSSTGLKSAIKPFAPIAVQPFVPEEEPLGEVVVYNAEYVTARKEQVLGSGMNRRRPYGVNLLDSPFPVTFLPFGATLYILLDDEAGPSPLGWAVTQPRADGTCAVTALFAGSIGGVNALLRKIARSCASMELLGDLAVPSSVLLDGAWEAHVGALRKITPAVASADEYPPPVPSADARRASVSHTLGVYDAMPHAVARRMYHKSARPVPPEGLETAWDPRRTRRITVPMIETGGGVRATGLCDLIVPYTTARLAARQDLVDALRESTLCQGNTYLSEAVDGLLGRGAAAVSQRIATDTFWVVTSEGGTSADVCAAAVTRVATPRVGDLGYRPGRQTEHWRRYGHRLTAPEMSIVYICWRAGMDAKPLLARLVEYARVRACARIWTQLRSDEAAQIAFLTGQGWVAQAGEIYALKL